MQNEMLNRFTKIPHKQFQNDHNEDFNRPHIYNIVIYNEYSGHTQKKKSTKTQNITVQKNENDSDCTGFRITTKAVFTHELQKVFPSSHVALGRR